MEKPTTDLGTDEIRKQHSVMVEGGAVARAKVMDQMIWDRYLMDGLITMVEHQACEYLLDQASKAGIFVKSPNMLGTRDGKKDYTPTGIFPFGRTLKIVEKRYGHHHSYVVCEVVCFNWDVSESKTNLKALKQSLNWIAERRMKGGKNPMRHLKSVTA